MNMIEKIWQFHSNSSNEENPSDRLRPSASVLVGGCFDILHYGHLQFLTAAKKLSDHLMIALEPDEKITRSKGRAAIHTQRQRAEILASLSIVDEIILLPSMQTYEEYFKLVSYLKPAFIAITKGDPQLNNKWKQAEAIGAEVIIVSDHLNALSSSKIFSEYERN